MNYEEIIDEWEEYEPTEDKPSCKIDDPECEACQ